MSSPRYPNGDDLRDFITSAGLLLADPDKEEEWEAFVDWNSIQAAANESFETATGRKFLAQIATRSFRAPRGLHLSLGLDLVSLSALTVGGVALVADTDFFLGPDGQDLLGRPFFEIEFVRPILAAPTPPKPIAITGPWGFSVAVPEGAWNGMLQQAAVTVSPQLALSISQGLMVWARGDSREEYSHYLDQGPLSTETKRWQTNITASVAGYLRTTY